MAKLPLPAAWLKVPENRTTAIYLKLETKQTNKQTKNKVTTKKAEGLGSLKLVFLVANESLVCQSGKDYLEADI